MTSETKQSIGWTSLVVGIIGGMVFLAVMLPHWLRTTGVITSKVHIAAWDQLHPEVYHAAWTEHHWSRTSTDYEYQNGKRIKVRTVRPAWDEYHPAYTTPAWTEHHPDEYTLFLEGSQRVAVNADTYEQAEKGDFWGADGFSGTRLIKTSQSE